MVFLKQIPSSPDIVMAQLDYGCHSNSLYLFFILGIKWSQCSTESGKFTPDIFRMRLNKIWYFLSMTEAKPQVKHTNETHQMLVLSYAASRNIYKKHGHCEAARLI